jgi:hypothetical protein
MTERAVTDTKPHLILFSTDALLLERLKPYGTALPYMAFEVGHGPEVTARAHLDALWATLMTGVELFGAVPPFPLHDARVLPTPPSQLKRGMPRYGVVGVAVSKDEGKVPDLNLRLVLSALLRAIKEFNSQGSDRIIRVGILPDDLELKRLEPSTAFKIIREIYEHEI